MDKTKTKEEMENLNIKEHDDVNHPVHYESCSLECKEIMKLMFGRKQYVMFCLMNAYKYMHRFKHKNGLQDLEKASWYLDEATGMREAEEIDTDKLYALRLLLKKLKESYLIEG